LRVRNVGHNEDEDPTSYSPTLCTPFRMEDMDLNDLSSVHC
jgi:hypothetical protein